MEMENQSNTNLKNSKTHEAKLQNYQVKVSLINSVIRIVVKNINDKSKFEGTYKFDQFSQTIRNIFQSIQDVYQQILQALNANQKQNIKRVVIDCDQNNFVFEYRILKKYVKQMLPIQEVMKPMLQKQIDELKKMNAKMQWDIELSGKRISDIQKMLQINRYENEKKENEKGFFSKLIGFQVRKKMPEMNYNIPQENQRYLRDQIKKLQEKLLNKIGAQIEFSHKDILTKAQNLVKEQSKQIQNNLMKKLTQIEALQAQQNNQLSWIKKIFADNIQQLGESIKFKKQELLESKLITFNQFFDTNHPHFNKFELINNNTIKLTASRQFDRKYIHLTSPQKITDKFNNYSVKLLSKDNGSFIFGVGSKCLKNNQFDQHLNADFVGFSYGANVYNQKFQRGAYINNVKKFQCPQHKIYEQKQKLRYYIKNANNASIYINLRRRQISLSFNGTVVFTSQISERLANKDLYPVIIMYNYNDQIYRKIDYQIKYKLENPNYISNHDYTKQLKQMTIQMDYS